MLKNAVVHGNRNDPAREVRHRVARLGDGRYRVETEDQGEGFDRGFHLAQGSGYAIIRSVADDILFSDEGNRLIDNVGTRG